MILIQIIVSVGNSIAPYVIEVKNSNDKVSGLEVDIAREIFALEGYEVEFFYQPLERTKLSFQQKGVDDVLTVKKDQ